VARIAGGAEIVGVGVGVGSSWPWRGTCGPRCGLDAGSGERVICGMRYFGFWSERILVAGFAFRSLGYFYLTGLAGFSGSGFYSWSAVVCCSQFFLSAKFLVVFRSCVFCPCFVHGCFLCAFSNERGLFLSPPPSLFYLRPLPSYIIFKKTSLTLPRARYRSQLVVPHERDPPRQRRLHEHGHPGYVFVGACLFLVVFFFRFLFVLLVLESGF